MVQERNMTAWWWPGRRWMCVSVCVCACLCVCVCMHRGLWCGWGGGEVREKERCGGGGWMRMLWKEEIRPASDIFDTTANHLSPSTAPVDHNPPPSLPQGNWPADSQISKCQWTRPPSIAADGALCFDHTKMRPHKISWWATAKFPSCVFQPKTWLETRFVQQTSAAQWELLNVSGQERKRRLILKN